MHTGATSISIPKGLNEPKAANMWEDAIDIDSEDEVVLVAESPGSRSTPRPSPALVETSNDDEMDDEVIFVRHLTSAPAVSRPQRHAMASAVSKPSLRRIGLGASTSAPRSYPEGLLVRRRGTNSSFASDSSLHPPGARRRTTASNNSNNTTRNKTLSQHQQVPRRIIRRNQPLRLPIHLTSAAIDVDELAAGNTSTSSQAASPTSSRVPMPTSRVRRTKKSKLPLTFTCGVCFEGHPISDAVVLCALCPDRFCGGCMMQFLKVATENRQYPLKCPGCMSAMDAWKCVNALHSTQPDTASSLSTLILEREHVGTLKYCSNKDCNTPFDFDGNPTESGARVQCPLCATATCVRCGSEWHEGKTCAEVVAGGSLAQLADTLKWKHCPTCNELVERVDGCDHITCKCGAEFCYRCGGKYTSGCTCEGGGDSDGDTELFEDDEDEEEDDIYMEDDSGEYPEVSISDIVIDVDGDSEGDNDIMEMTNNEVQVVPVVQIEYSSIDDDYVLPAEVLN